MENNLRFKTGDMVVVKVPWKHPYLGVIHKVRQVSEFVLPYTVLRIMSEPRYYGTIPGEITGGMLTDYISEELIMYCPREEV